MSSSSGSFLAGAMAFSSSNETEKKEPKCILATCGIWESVSQQNGKFIGTGSLIKDFFLKCDKKIHLVTSDKVISSDKLNCYSLYFKKSKDKGEEPKKLVDMVSDDVIFKSGLTIVPVDTNKLNFKKKRILGSPYQPLFTIPTKVRKDLRNDQLYCQVVESSGGPFTITPYQVKGIADKETYIADDISGKMESSRFYKDHRKGLGAPITITVDEEAVVVGAITLDNNNQISFVLFSEIDRKRICSDGDTLQTSSSSKDAGQQETFEHSVDQDTPAQDSGTSLTSSSSKDVMQQETFEQSVDQDTPAQDGGTLMTSSSSKDARQQETFEHSVDQDTPAQGKRKMPPYQYAIEIENGRTGSENGMVTKGQQDWEGNLTVGNQHTSQSNHDAAACNQGSNWWSSLKLWLPFWNNSDRYDNNGNMSLSSLGNSCYEVSIEPAKTPLKGEGSCWFTFNPDLPSDITSGSAKFFGLGSIDLKGVKHTTNCFVGRRIPISRSGASDWQACEDSH